MEIKELHRQIKSEVEECYKTIKDAEELLKKLRDDCHHPETELVTYSTRPGQYWADTEVCSICGEVIKWAYEDAAIEIKEDELTPEEISDELGWLANRNHG